MKNQRAVWIDLCCMPHKQGLWRDVQTQCEVTCITQMTEVASTIAAQRPHFAAIEYDYPDRARLAAVPLVRREFPDLPLLMFTEFHTEALALWAFRSRVWDYRVKPVDAETLTRLIDVLMSSSADPSAFRAPSVMESPPDLGTAGHLARPPGAAARTAAAVAWISEHYAERSSIKFIAGLCHLCESEFSRVFHREHGMSFCRFVLQYRVARARELLREPGVRVSQVAYEVGFNDLSYFGRVFRRFVGESASQYQRRGLR